MDIEYRENCLSPEDFIRLRIAVGRVATPLPQAEAALREGFDEKLGFEARPDDHSGAGMIRYIEK